MHHNRTRSHVVIAMAIAVSLIFGMNVHAEAPTPGQLIKASQAAVYYYSSDGKRYVFPNESVFKTWYEDFNSVIVISDAELASIQIGGNITYKPGARMVKIKTDPKVYAVAQGGVLRWVADESVARAIYGSNWATLVNDVSDAYFSNYVIGTKVASANDFSPITEFNSSKTIGYDLESHRNALSNAGSIPSPVQPAQPNPVVITPVTPTIPASPAIPITPTTPTPQTTATSTISDPCAGTQTPSIAADTTYLIITRPMFVPVLTPFLQDKNWQGDHVQVVTADDIACHVSGIDVPERIRNLLAQASTGSPNLAYVLIIGDVRTMTGNTPPVVTTLSEPWEVPIRYVTPVGTYQNQAPPIPTDQYYADPTGDWSANAQSRKDYDFKYRYAVGRIPAQTVSDVSAWSDKTLAWVPPENAVESQFKTVQCNGSQPSESDRYLAAYTHSMTFNICTNDDGGDIAAISNQQRPDIVSSYSHGAYDGIYKWPFTKGFTLTKDSPGFVKPPFMFVHGCEVAGLDYDQRSLGEKLILDPHGVVAFVGATRSHWDIIFPYWNSVFYEGEMRAGNALYVTKHNEATRTLMPLTEVDNLFMFNLLGDPELELERPGIVMTADTHTLIAPVNTSTTSFNLTISSRLNGSVNGQQLTSVIPGDNHIYATDISLGPKQTIQRRIDADPRWVLPYYPYGIQVLTLGVCDPSITSCIIPKFETTRGVFLSCARVSRDPDGTYQLQTKIMNTPDQPFSLMFDARAGKLQQIGMTESTIPVTLITTIPISMHMSGEVFTFKYDPNAIGSDPVPTSTANNIPYHFPYYAVHAYSSSGEEIGRCAPVASAESEYK